MNGNDHRSAHPSAEELAQGGGDWLAALRSGVTTNSPDVLAELAQEQVLRWQVPGTAQGHQPIEAGSEP